MKEKIFQPLVHWSGLGQDKAKTKQLPSGSSVAGAWTQALGPTSAALLKSREFTGKGSSRYSGGYSHGIPVPQAAI